MGWVCTKKDGFGALNANAIARFSLAVLNGEALSVVLNTHSVGKFSLQSVLAS